MLDKNFRKKILFVINSLAGGGAERVILELLSASSDLSERYDIALVLLDNEKRDYEPPEWLTIYQLDSHGKFIKSIVEFCHIIRKLRPAATLSFLTRSNFACIISSKIFGHKAIISERVNTSGHFLRGVSALVSKKLVRLTYPLADTVIAVSSGIADDLTSNFGVLDRKIRVIANPVDSDRIQLASTSYNPYKIEKPYAVSVSRLTKNKNVVLLVDALKKSGLDLPLVILGQGPELDAIKRRARELAIEDQVILLGFVPNPYPIIASATCYLSGSNAEGFPNGLVEALALGKSVVATNCPSGPAEILLNMKREQIDSIFVGEYGTLVPQNDIDAMAKGIRLAVEPERVAALAIAAPKKAAEFSLVAAKNKYWREIETVIN